MCKKLVGKSCYSSVMYYFITNSKWCRLSREEWGKNCHRAFAEKLSQHSGEINPCIFSLFLVLSPNAKHYLKMQNLAKQQLLWQHGFSRRDHIWRNFASLATFLAFSLLQEKYQQPKACSMHTKVYLSFKVFKEKVYINATLKDWKSFHNT